MSRSTAKTVRLGELDYDPVVLAMPGQEARLEKVDDLVASIGAEGVLQSLKVRTSPDADRYLVTAGLRRLTALQQLRNEHGTILGEPVTNETLVPVVYSEESDDAARRQAVAENVQRVALTVGAEVKQFAELAKTMPNKEIAARFGVTEKRVAQRLKLAGLHSDVLEALDAGKIKIATAEAFTLEEDPDKQAKYLKKNLNNSYNLEPYRIREAFTKKLVSAGSAIARHIGEDDYAAAGGETFADPFSDAVYWISEDLIERLAAERTTALVEAWKAEGWAFVETVDEFGKTDWGYPKVWQARRIDRGESEDGEPVPFTAEQKALSGVVYWPDAEHAPEFGVVKAGTVLPGDDEPKAPPPPDFWRPGGDVSQVLQRALGEAVASKVEADPLVALRLLVAQLAFTMVANGNGWSSIVHICAHGDLFHESVPDDWIDMVFAVMALCPQHTFQVLTKRPERMRRYMTAPGVVRRVYELACDRALEPGADVILIPPGIDEKLAPPGPRVFLDTWPIANVWLGTSIEDQPTADTRIPYLLQTPAAVRWISAEPLLGPVNLNAIHEHFDTLGGGSLDTWESALNGKRFDPWSDGDIGGMPKLDWVVAGGESGPGARPMHPDWARSLRDQCAAAGVPFLFKQWGEWAPTGFTTIIEADGTNCPPNIAWPDGTIRWGAAAERGGAGMQLGLVGKKASGRLLDGVEYNGFPVRP